LAVARAYLDMKLKEPFFEEKIVCLALALGLATCQHEEADGELFSYVSVVDIHTVGAFSKEWCANKQQDWIQQNSNDTPTSWCHCYRCGQSLVISCRKMEVTPDTARDIDIGPFQSTVCHACAEHVCSESEICPLSRDAVPLLVLAAYAAGGRAPVRVKVPTANDVYTISLLEKGEHVTPDGVKLCTLLNAFVYQSPFDTDLIDAFAQWAALAKKNSNGGYIIGEGLKEFMKNRESVPKRESVVGKYQTITLDGVLKVQKSRTLKQGLCDVVNALHDKVHSLHKAIKSVCEHPLEGDMGGGSVMTFISFQIPRDNKPESLHGTPAHADQGPGVNAAVALTREGLEKGKVLALWFWMNWHVDGVFDAIEAAISAPEAPVGLFEKFEEYGGLRRIQGDLKPRGSVKAFPRLSEEEMRYLHTKVPHGTKIVEQCHGDVVMVPPGVVHTVTNLMPSLKVAYDLLPDGEFLRVLLLHWMVVVPYIGQLNAEDYVSLQPTLLECFDDFYHFSCATGAAHQ